MRKREFLEALESKLSESLSPASVREHLKYYMNYIDGACAQGKSEAEVIAELGDPNLIARTILETSDSEEYVYTEEYGESQDTYSPEPDIYGDEQSSAGGIHHIHTANGSCLIAFIVCVVILFLLMWILGAVMRLILPILLPILLIGFLIRYFRSR